MKRCITIFEDPNIDRTIDRLYLERIGYNCVSMVTVNMIGNEKGIVFTYVNYSL